ncbi:MAG: phage holin family protein [Pseudomonadota bacterium]
MNEQSAFSQGQSPIRDILLHLSNLIRKEVDLARTEVGENLTRAGVAIGLLIGAIVIALTALNVLSAALVGALVSVGLASGWAALIVGASLAAIALGLTVKGLNDLKLSSLAPTRTAENIERDVATIKESFHD